MRDNTFKSWVCSLAHGNMRAVKRLERGLRANCSVNCSGVVPLDPILIGVGSHPRTLPGPIISSTQEITTAHRRVPPCS